MYKQPEIHVPLQDHQKLESRQTVKTLTNRFSVDRTDVMICISSLVLVNPILIQLVFKVRQNISKVNLKVVQLEFLKVF